MISDNIKSLVIYRLQQADESLEAARTLFEKKLNRQVINRSYYAMFYAVSALLALRKRETSRHSGAIALFDREFVKSGMFAKDFSRWLHDAFDLRQRSDYSIGIEINREEAEITLHYATTFVQGVRESIDKLISDSDT